MNQCQNILVCNGFFLIRHFLETRKRLLQFFALHFKAQFADAFAKGVLARMFAQDHGCLLYTSTRAQDAAQTGSAKGKVAAKTVLDIRGVGQSAQFGFGGFIDTGAIQPLLQALLFAHICTSKKGKGSAA